MMIKTRSDEDKIELSLKRAASHFVIPKFRLKIEWTATLGSDFRDKVPEPWLLSLCLKSNSRRHESHNVFYIVVLCTLDTIKAKASLDSVAFLITSALSQVRSFM